MTSIASLDSFVASFLNENPFDSNRVTPVGEALADAADVSRKPFEQLRRSLDRAHREKVGLGVLLWGEAGIGKSHLLARLQRWAGVEPVPALVLTLSNLQAEPQRLPRALLRGVLDMLSLGRARSWRHTPLFRIVNGMARYAIRNGGPASKAVVERRFDGLIEQLCREMPSRAGVFDPTIFRVLFHFLLSVLDRTKQGTDDGVAHIAIRYLRGDGIENGEARRLGLAPSSDASQTVALADDEQVKKVLVALAQAAWFWGRPLVLALDQVDNLEPAQFQAFGRFLHALLDAATNLVVITSGVRATLFNWRYDNKILQDSSWDRIAQEEMELQRLAPGDCPPVLAVRLQAFLAPFGDVPQFAERMRRDALFPLGEGWLRERLEAKLEVRPRDLIHWARLGWEQQQTALRDDGVEIWLEGWRDVSANQDTPLPLTPLRIQGMVDQAVADRLEKLREKKKTELEFLDWDPESLADQLYDLAKHWVKRDGWPYLQAVERVPVNGNQRPTRHLILQQRLSATGPDLRREVACVLSGSGLELTAQLKRLRNGDALPQQLILVHEQRSGFQPGAKGREIWNDLAAGMGENLKLWSVDLDEQAWLAGTNALLREAASGEVEVALAKQEVRGVTRGEALESLIRQELFPGSAVLNFLLRMEATAEAAAASG